MIFRTLTRSTCFLYRLYLSLSQWVCETNKLSLQRWRLIWCNVRHLRSYNMEINSNMKIRSKNITTSPYVQTQSGSFWLCIFTSHLKINFNLVSWNPQFSIIRKYLYLTLTIIIIICFESYSLKYIKDFVETFSE